MYYLALMKKRKDGVTKHSKELTVTRNIVGSNLGVTSEQHLSLVNHGVWRREAATPCPGMAKTFRSTTKKYCQIANRHPN